MTYLSDVANAIRANVPNALVPDEDAETLFLIYAVLGLTRGTQVTRSDVHDAWTAWMHMRGQTHESMVPFHQLADDVRAEDEPFVDAIKKAVTHS